MEYCVAHKVDMVFLYVECGRNSTAAAATYNERFPDRRPTNRRQVSAVVKKFKDTGSVLTNVRSGRPKSATNAHKQTEVLQAIAGNPHTSSRAVGKQLRISHQSVLRVLHSNKFHPYHVHLHQALKESDYQWRLDYCNWLDSQLDDNEEFLTNVLWSDEANFCQDGNVNIHNAHYWARENPHWLREHHHQERFRVNVWCGIHSDTIVGPFFLPHYLNGERYLALLQNEVKDFTNQLPVEFLEDLWFQQDGAPPHFAIDVREYLNNTFPGHWIGRGGAVKWPPRSPDLSPLDFFLWGFVKERIYATQPESAVDLQNRIVEACAQITPEILRNVRQSVLTRIRSCIAVDGRHFEHFLDLN